MNPSGRNGDAGTGRAVPSRIRVLLPVSVSPRLPFFKQCLPLLLVAALFLARLGARELYSSHEARAAQNAQRMLTTGEWGLPVLFDGQVDLQKPPGFYWLVAAVGWLNGGEVTALSARLPAAVAGLVTVAVVWWFLRRSGRPTAAIVAALTLATATHFTAIARTARIDVPLACAVAVSLVAFHRGCQGGRLGWHVVAAAAAAVAILLKGPVGLALIGTVAVAWLIAGRARITITPAVLGTLVVAGLALPWFVWANHTTGGEFVRVFVWHHNVARFTGSSATLASHPWWYYAPRFAADFLPWTPALVGLVAWAVRRGLWHADPLFRFGVVWFVVMVGVLSCAKFKRADYLLPAYTGVAIALGCAAEAWLATREVRSVRLAKLGFGVALVGVAAGWTVMTYHVEPAEQAKQEKRAFAEHIRAHAPPPQTVLMFRAESHLLAYHLGRPLHTLVEWKELNDRLAEPGNHVVVMPPEYVYPAEQIVTARRLVVVARLEDFTPAAPPRPLVFLRTAD